MGRIVFAGGGIVGTCAAMMLANDGHEVTVLERDPAPPPPPDDAWDDWDRTRCQPVQDAALLPRPGSASVADAELPGLTEAMEAAGALRMNPLDGHSRRAHRRAARRTTSVSTTVTARRPVAESVVACHGRCHLRASRFAAGWRSPECLTGTGPTASCTSPACAPRTARRSPPISSSTPADDARRWPTGCATPDRPARRR